VLGLAPRAELVLSPYILALQIAPKVAFAPLFVLWLGFTIYPKILVAVLIVFFPVMVNVLTAVRTISPVWINVARSFNANRWQIFLKIQFPATMPSLFAGLRIASTLAVIGVVVGEMVGGNKGLGYLLVLGQGRGDTAAVFVSIRSSASWDTALSSWASAVSFTICRGHNTPAPELAAGRSP
jgi:NitT/TauT family transport system permease protein